MDVCRLCLDLITTGGKTKPLHWEARDMVQVVAPELNLDVSQDASTCTECRNTLGQLFEFKSNVLEREREVRERVGDRKGRLGLKAALTGEVDLGSAPPVDGNAKGRLCRTCLGPIECASFTALRPDTQLNSVLDMCLAEVDLELTKDPLMCETCLDHLQKLHHFISSCRDVEDKIADYRERKGIAEGESVDLHCVLEAELAKWDPDGVGSGKVKTEDVESEDEEGETSEGGDDDDDGLKQEELDIKSDAGTSDGDNSACDFYGSVQLQEANSWLTVNHSPNADDDFKHMPCSDNANNPLEKPKFNCHDDTPLEKKPTRIFNCIMCSFSSALEQNISNHYEITGHGSKWSFQEQDQYFCSMCSFRTISKLSLQNHCESIHVEDKTDRVMQGGHADPDKLRKDNEKQIDREMNIGSKLSLRYNTSADSADKSSTKKYPCSKCSFNTLGKDKLKSHNQSSHDPKQSGSNLSLTHVANLINVKKFFKYSYEEKLKLKGKGRPLPDIIIEKSGVSRGKSYTRKFNRDIYLKNEWICGCNKKNALYCFPCLLFGGDKAWTECVFVSNNYFVLFCSNGRK